MTSVYATSPSTAAFHGSPTPAGHMMSTSPPRLARRPSSGLVSPRRSAANTVPSSSSAHAHIHYSPLHLPRGHDSSDVAALSASLDRSTGLSCSLQGVNEANFPPSYAGAGPSSQHQPPDLRDEVPVSALSSYDDEPMGPFEGPEKLLELWFADAEDDVLDGGLLNVDRQVWENMLDIVKCKVLSIVHGHHADAYLLSESSMFVFPHKLILKTCGTTTLLLGLERLLSIAFDTLTADDHPTPAASLGHLDLGRFVKRCFYSRKSFMFPERQKGPHRDWLLEVGLLDEFFSSGSAYTVGKMNGNHWLLYMTSPAQTQEHAVSVARPLRLPSLSRPVPPADETLEILMTHLSPASCARFEFPAGVRTPESKTVEFTNGEEDRGHVLGSEVCRSLGLSQLYDDAIIDAYAFEPCGFSANAVIGQRHPSCAEDGYWTVHVTPEQDSSYASFETNITACRGGMGLPWLIVRVLSIFEPARLSVTLFTSKLNEGDGADKPGKGVTHVEKSKDAVVREMTLNEKADQGDILHALQLDDYRRTDRIAYEFEDYNLIFVSFDKLDGKLTRA